jgi:hypothetical protein
MKKTALRAMLAFAFILAACGPAEGQVRSERTIVKLPDMVNIGVTEELASDGSVLNCDYELPGVGDEYEDGVTWTLWLRRGDELVETPVRGELSGFSTLPEGDECPVVDSIAMSIVYYQTVFGEWWNECRETGPGIVECAVNKEVEQ